MKEQIYVSFISLLVFLEAEQYVQSFLNARYCRCSLSVLQQNYYCKYVIFRQ